MNISKFDLFRVLYLLTLIVFIIFSLLIYQPEKRREFCAGQAADVIRNIPQPNPDAYQSFNSLTADCLATSSTISDKNLP